MYNFYIGTYLKQHNTYIVNVMKMLGSIILIYYFQ